MSSYAGKNAIVTGGASGIGRALCKAMAARGVRLTVADIDATGARRLADQLGEGATAVELDVREADAVEQVVKDHVGRHGSIDYMFNNAGVAVLGDVRDTTLEDWKRIFDINVGGVVNGVRAAYPIMVEQGHGHLVNTASLAGLIPTPGFTAYAATKHAVVGLSRSLRIEAAEHGVKVTAVCPGFVKTSIVDNATLHGLDRRAATEAVPIWYDADDCARDILKVLPAGRDVEVITGHGKQLYRLSRVAPRLLEWFGRYTMKRARTRA